MYDCNVYAEAGQLLVTQRASVVLLLNTVEEYPDAVPRLSGRLGSLQFYDRIERLRKMTNHFSSRPRDRLVEINRAADELYTSCNTFRESHRHADELIGLARDYVKLTDDLMNELDAEGDKALVFENMIPIVMLITLAWVISLVVAYWTCFRLSYGYDLFMRDFA